MGAEDTHSSVENLCIYNITSLPPEILWQIFDNCHLKDLLNLSRVCQLFLQFVSRILQNRCRDLVVYDISDYSVFLRYFDLRDAADYYQINGPHITRIRYRRNVPKEVDDTFIQNIQYFPNLLHMEILGSFGQDINFLELVKRCKKLKSIVILCGNAKLLRGEDLLLLQSLEHLKLANCTLSLNQLKPLRQMRQLKILNMVESIRSADIEEMVGLCQHLQHIHTLRLTALTHDPVFLKAILTLPSLKCLQFCWESKNIPLHFEENLFQALKDNSQKSETLNCLKFETGYFNVFDDNKKWNADTYAVTTENMDMGHLWLQWTDEVFEKISQALQSFTQLQCLNFRNCRPLTYEQLNKLPEINKNIRLITIYGWPRKEDSQFLKQWLHNDCELKFESVLSLTEARKRDTETIYEPLDDLEDSSLLSTIECTFSTES